MLFRTAVCCAIAVGLGWQFARAADDGKPESPPAAGSAEPDSEQQLEKRRQERLKQLPAPPAPPQVSAELTNPIDRFITSKWQDAEGNFEPQLCDDATFLRGPIST